MHYTTTLTIAHIITTLGCATTVGWPLLLAHRVTKEGCWLYQDTVLDFWRPQACSPYHP